jgi:hypothetical protein
MAASFPDNVLQDQRFLRMEAPAASGFNGASTPLSNVGSFADSANNAGTPKPPGSSPLSAGTHVVGARGSASQDRSVTRPPQLSFTASVRSSKNCPQIAVDVKNVKKFNMRSVCAKELEEAVRRSFKLPNGLEVHFEDPIENELIPTRELTTQAPRNVQALHDQRHFEVVMKTPEKEGATRATGAMVPRGVGVEKRKKGRPQATGEKQTTVGQNNNLTDAQKKEVINLSNQHHWGHSDSGAPLPYGILQKEKPPSAADYHHPVYDCQPICAVQSFNQAALSSPRLNGAHPEAINTYIRQWCLGKWQKHHVATKDGRFLHRDTGAIAIYRQYGHLKGRGPIPGLEEHLENLPPRQVGQRRVAGGVRTLTFQLAADGPGRLRHLEDGHQAGENAGSVAVGDGGQENGGEENAEGEVVREEEEDDIDIGNHEVHH